MRELFEIVKTSLVEGAKGTAIIEILKIIGVILIGLGLRILMEWLKEKYPILAYILAFVLLIVVVIIVISVV